MRTLALGAALLGGVAAGAQYSPTDSLMLRSIYNEALSNGQCYDNLRVLCKDIGARLSGSEEADKAIAWGKDLLEASGFQNVYLQAVQVPHWERGATETCSMNVNGLPERLRVTALGGSVGTGGVLTGEVVEVRNFDELDALGREEVEGKIVFFNRPMDPVLINTGAAYGGAYDQRGKGASKAAEYGGIGALVRSLTHALDTFPHTGGMGYTEGVPQVSAAGICTVDARKLHQALERGDEVTVSLDMDCQKFPDKQQYNVIGEIPGTEFPDEYIVVGGHLDSWDIGEGAHDDGAGIVQSIEALRILMELGYKPKRTLRVVLYINEENGNNGGKTYAKEAKDAGMVHFAAIESDAGGFTPRGFRLEGSDAQMAFFSSLEPLFEPYEIHVFRRGFSGVDIRPLKDDRVALFGLVPDSQRYFDVHHSNNDIFENVHKRELELGAATVASLAYLIDLHGDW